MEPETPTDPLAYVVLGAAVTMASFLGIPRDLGMAAQLATLLFVAIRRKPALSHIAFGAAGWALIEITIRLPHGALGRLLGGIGSLLGTLVLIGLVGGVVIGWRRPPAAQPGFRFLREDFFEFCGFVGMVAAFPAVLQFGIRGAADWVGRIAFELAFVGAWALLPMSVAAYAVGRLRHRGGSDQPVTSVLESA